MAEHVSLDGRRFRAADTSHLLECHERAGVVWGRYTTSDAAVALVLGTREGDVIDLRCCYVDISRAANVATIRASVVLLDDGRVRLDGDAVLDEVTCA